MPPGKATSGMGPLNSNSPTQTTAPNTRKTTRSQTSVEEIMATRSAVMDTESAEAYLASKLLCQVGQPFTLTHLSTILFHIRQMFTVTPVPVNAAICAVAFLLKKQMVCEIAEAAAKELALTLSALAPQIAGVHAASESLAKTAQKTEDTLAITLDKAECLHRIARDERTEQEGGVSVASKRLEETADALYATITDCQNTIKLLAPSLDATQDRTNHLSLQMTSTPTPIIPHDPAHLQLCSGCSPPSQGGPSCRPSSCSGMRDPSRRHPRLESIPTWNYKQGDSDSPQGSTQ
ncbi:hypothetical protein DFJ58DRAFT_726025 [Suillus subalutaceus]|uniref:uncharacterized protein n=1 Tax=Suillus subalutaceus TaxID=48586 RepID=UPI001B85FEFB|nr:uncharacterized protein DFJ58DRAFT_726025 [Suillus subalutaceus]KAG1860233.1 hypothetical protein DFJ58DRAFT_726025 [Suillus subalutaceus]